MLKSTLRASLLFAFAAYALCACSSSRIKPSESIPCQSINGGPVRLGSPKALLQSSSWNAETVGSAFVPPESWTTIRFYDTNKVQFDFMAFQNPNNRVNAKMNNSCQMLIHIPTIGDSIVASNYYAHVWYQGILVNVVSNVEKSKSSDITTKTLDLVIEDLSEPFARSEFISVGGLRDYNFMRAQNKLYEEFSTPARADGHGYVAHSLIHFSEDR